MEALILFIPNNKLRFSNADFSINIESQSIMSYVLTEKTFTVNTFFKFLADKTRLSFGLL